ncbi:MAG: GNVR domain-containing protein [Aliarcobacter sp.]
MEILNYQNLILNLQNQIENLNKEKQNIISEKIPSLKRNLEFDIKNKLDSLNDKIKLQKLKLANNIAKNSEIVGDLQIDEDPIKPKKSLIVVVAFVTGFIISIFLVFIIIYENYKSSFRKSWCKVKILRFF